VVDTSDTEDDEDSVFETEPRAGTHVFTAQEDYLHRSITSCDEPIGGTYQERLREPRKIAPERESYDAKE